MIQSILKPKQTGDELKSDAHRLLERARADLVEHGCPLLLEQVLKVGSVTTDSIRGKWRVPPGIDSVCYGAIPGPLARAGIMEADGWVDSYRPEAHCRPVKRWRLSDEVAAWNWLATHPETMAQRAIRIVEFVPDMEG